MSDAVVFGGVVYLSGAITRDTALNVGGQTRDILEQIDARLAWAGSAKDRLLSASIWLADRADFMAMNAVWEAWLGDAPRPARATVEAGLMISGLRVEIAVVAGCDFSG